MNVAQETEQPAEFEPDFGAERRHEAQLTLRAMMSMMTGQPFRGCFHAAGEAPVLLVGTDIEADAAYYAEAIKAACRAWGAEVSAMPHEPVSLANGLAPLERILIAAQLPPVAQGKPNELARQLMEACAEVVRVLLAGAIITAKADCKPGEKVLAVFLHDPEVGARKDFDTNILAALARVRVAVVCESAPEVSYLMGSRAGDSPFDLVWGIPLVELFHGPNRIRWMDLRSPGHLEAEQIVAAGARVS